MMDELERVIKYAYLNKIYTDMPHGLSDTDIKTLAQAIRNVGYHKDPEKFCYAPMQQQNPPPKRKRIENEN